MKTPWAQRHWIKQIDKEIKKRDRYANKMRYQNILINMLIDAYKDQFGTDLRQLNKEAKP